MRAWIALLLLPLAGCVEEAPGDVSTAELPNLSAYTFWMADASGMPGGNGNGLSLDFMVRVTNHEPKAVNYTMWLNISEGTMGPVVDGAWKSTAVNEWGDANVTDSLGPGDSRLWIVQGGFYNCHCAWMQLWANGEAVVDEVWDTHDGGGDRVVAGTHVQTVTVGVWTNGTVFYTNDAAMLSDPAFPAGGHINRTQAIAESAPLPVYIYETDRTDQPPASRDQCYFTTIPGYNALLKQQTTGASGVRFLSPEAGYTRSGNEAHFLYGEPLIFMNAIVAVDGPVAITDGPDPNGACFDQQNTIDYISERAPI